MSERLKAWVYNVSTNPLNEDQLLLANDVAALLGENARLCGELDQAWPNIKAERDAQMKSKIKVGDRVKMYLEADSECVGIVAEVRSSRSLVVREINGARWFVHPKQCRKLIKRKTFKCETCFP